MLHKIFFLLLTSKEQMTSQNYCFLESGRWLKVKNNNQSRKLPILAETVIMSVVASRKQMVFKRKRLAITRS